MAHGHHIIPKKTLFSVFAALIGLTLLTVITALTIDFGVLEIPVALAIASTKALLVVIFFMALKYDNRVNALAITVGLVFVSVFIIFTMLDTVFRGDLDNVSNITISQQEREDEQLRAREPDADQLRVAPADFVGVDDDEASAAVDEAATADEAPAQ
ncbi:MAG: oxidase [Bacteroidetes bacterium]|jgi:cytochrome c oxidase subunit 4|nr:oxidase [Bacteroidota bacterium]